MDIKITQNAKEKEHAFRIRTLVFVEEQKVPVEEEIDEYDKTAIHFVGYEDNKPIAASRLRFVEEYGKLERICVLNEFRGKSYGKEIIAAMEQIIKENGYKRAKLNAQTHAEGFYQKLGYKTVSDKFLDAGIPHVTMIKESL
ncbi:GNAT family N-acetyltransferase [Ornithinibacillus bavariensis]|uniref:N-acetyltransferase n=1 Tax=Ornithinibacillus bavariensis TaxID=545502 RepID=A0A919X5A3_9BACI|nr:GNAT family N-acetyltransferase [Ornithinibacillus bavariensis]GIO25786.1 N-acetyltransferase [Ornithinibacillus bavariensis]HAM79808.1 GNAT family N-acetyltransferase [Ornithinibacillus sp.]